MEGWCLYQTCPTGTSHWDKHNLSQWDRQIGTGCACPSGTSCACPKPVPLGLGKVKRDLSYTHAGGLSLLQDKPYDHDGTCPSPTCPNLSHEVALQGREEFHCVGLEKPKEFSKSRDVLKALSWGFTFHCSFSKRTVQIWSTISNRRGFNEPRKFRIIFL